MLASSRAPVAVFGPVAGLVQASCPPIACCRRDRKRGLVPASFGLLGCSRSPSRTNNTDGEEDESNRASSPRARCDATTPCSHGDGDSDSDGSENHTPRKIRRNSADFQFSSACDEDSDEFDSELVTNLLPAVSSLLTRATPTAASATRRHSPLGSGESSGAARSSSFSSSPCSVTQVSLTGPANLHREEASKPAEEQEQEDEPQTEEDDANRNAAAPHLQQQPSCKLAPFTMSLQSYLLIKSLPAHEQMMANNNQRQSLLPPKGPNSKKVTLVLDLDETLVHCGFQADPAADIQLQIQYGGQPYTVFGRRRPHLQAFLAEASRHFEVVCFTASQRLYAEKIIQLIDPCGHISHSLFREACVNVQGNFIKDLTLLGRDLRHTILLDNSPHAFGFQVENGIPIVSWFNDAADDQLPATMSWLKTLATADDVRPHVARKFRLRERLASRAYAEHLRAEHFRQMQRL
eukprot:INCI7643.3.p1 GENE.INCI7643.3~~INCI7643.3.p1  ORF type:complete len:464 (-),score=76.52 INCI7643.3:2033-3424(-)